MASPSLTNGDMPVTIKLNVDGTSRRMKLPLRDLTREVLEPKVRRESSLQTSSGGGEAWLADC